MFYKLLIYNRKKYDYEDLFDFVCTYEEVTKIIKDINLLCDKLPSKQRIRLNYSTTEEDE